MGYRCVIKVGNRILYSKSYPSAEAAKRAGPHIRGWTGKIHRS